MLSVVRMSNVLNRTKRQQILGLGSLGWSLRRIEAETGVRRETVSRYLKAAGIGVREPGGWGHGEPKAAIEVITDPGAKAAKEVITDPAAKAAIETITDPPEQFSRRASLCEPHREEIEAALGLGRTAMSIWQDLVEEGFMGRYASVQRFVRMLRESTGRDAHPIIATERGVESQVDYGDGPMVRNPETGKHRRTRLFVLTLGNSRKAVRLLCWKSSTKTWCQLHERAFRRLGGTTKVVVLDNLREGVLKADVYDPQLNPLYRDMLAHYGVTALPCRVQHPDRKGKVESAIAHTQSALRGRRFETLEEAQQWLDRWDERWADTRIHGTTKRQVAAMFAEERPHLTPLPTTPFRYYQHGARTVHLDGCVEVEAAYYGVPPGHVGRRVHVQWDDLNVRVLDPKTGALLRQHRRARRGHHRIHPDDLPKKTPPSTTDLLRRATRAGAQVGEVARQIHARDGEPGTRRILGLLSLVKKYGAGAVDGACSTSLDLGSPTYQAVKRLLEREPSLGQQIKQIDPLIRGLSEYRDIINTLSEGETSHEHP